MIKLYKIYYFSGFSQYPQPQQQYPPANFQGQYPPANIHGQYPPIGNQNQYPPTNNQGYPNYPPSYSQPGYGQVVQHQPNAYQPPPQVTSGMLF